MISLTGESCDGAFASIHALGNGTDLLLKSYCFLQYYLSVHC